MKKVRKILSVILVMIMFLGNLPAFAAVNSSAKLEYLKTEKTFWGGLNDTVGKSELGQISKFLSAIGNKYSAELDAEVKIPDMKTRRYVVKENEIIDDMYEDATIEAYVDGEKVATMEAVVNGSILSARVPELYEKFLSLDASDMASFIKKFDEDIDVSQISAQTVNSAEINKILKLTKAEEKIINNAYKKYAKLLEKEFLDEVYFTKGQNTVVDVNNSQYNCSSVSYSISLAQILDSSEIIWKEFKNDTELVNLLWGKFEKLYNFTAKTYSYEEELPTREQVFALVDTLINELQKEDAIKDVVLKSTLYHKNNKLLKRDLSVDGVSTTISIYTVDKNNGAYYAIVIDDVKLEDVVVKNGAETIHNFTMTSKDYKYEFVDGDFKREEFERRDNLIVKISKIGKNKYNIEIPLDEQNIKISMEYTRNKITKSECDFVANFKVIIQDKIFEINTRTIYKKGANIKKISTKNKEVNLNKESKESLIKLFDDNKAQIEEKIKGKFGTAFYLDEVLKSQQDTLQRMQVRTDKVKAAQIGMAVRIWYTDVNTDPYFNPINNISAENWIRAKDLDQIENYCYIDSTSDGSDYYVCLTGSDYYSYRVVVATSKTGTDLPLPSIISSDLNDEHILYVEQ